MRRKDREITGTEELLAIIRANKVCRLGMTDDDQPYVVPLNYGFEFDSGGLVLYFHGAGEGKKIGILKKNSRVCFEIDGEHGLDAAGEKAACEYGFYFASVIGFGNACFIDGEAEKARALGFLMKHQTGEDREFGFAPEHLRAVTVFKVKALSFTGKRRAPPPERPPLSG